MNNKKSFSLITLCTGFMALMPCFAAQEILSQQDAAKFATQVYIYGYPLVTMDLTRRVMTNVAKPEAMKAPMGQFVNLKTYPDASFKDVTTPNADTLYSSAWLDLKKEPYILHVPNAHGRYYLMPMLDAWSNVFASPGTRTTGTKSQDFAITGPSWKGKLPHGVKRLKSPTDIVWILGRTYCTGTPEDYTVVHALQAQYKLMPLSTYGKPYTPQVGTVDKSLNMTTSVRDQVNAQDAATYFNNLVLLLKQTSPSVKDGAMVETMKKIGMQAGEPFDMTKLDPNVAKGLEQAIKMGQDAIKAQDANGVMRNGWQYNPIAGVYGTDYLQRAYIAAFGLGANLPQDALYPATKNDKDGKALTGSHKYVIHFEKGSLPPVKGFWSLTMYDDQLFFVDNSLSRYTLSQRNAFKTNADGSIDLYIQHTSPGTEKEANWLPAPLGKFILMFRFYWPKEAIINGSWQPPAVQRV